MLLAPSHKPPLATSSILGCATLQFADFAKSLLEELVVSFRKKDGGNFSFIYHFLVKIDKVGDRIFDRSNF